MTAVDRVFRVLVRKLAERGADRLRSTLQVSEIYQSLIPYRTCKVELGFDSVEDYEMAILRLVAGEGDLTTIDPADVREVLLQELENVVPDAGAFRDFAAARLSLNPRAVQQVLDEQAAYAPTPPPEPSVAVAGQPDRGDSDASDDEPNWDGLSNLERPERPAAPAPSSPALVFESVEQPATCPDCRGTLPANRKVRFCPFCGTPVAPGVCRQCGEALEPTWHFCVSCGIASAG